MYKTISYVGIILCLPTIVVLILSFAVSNEHVNNKCQIIDNDLGLNLSGWLLGGGISELVLIIFLCIVIFCILLTKCLTCIFCLGCTLIDPESNDYSSIVEDNSWIKTIIMIVSFFFGLFHLIYAIIGIYTLSNYSTCLNNILGISSIIQLVYQLIMFIFDCYVFVILLINGHGKNKK